MSLSAINGKKILRKNIKSGKKRPGDKQVCRCMISSLTRNESLNLSAYPVSLFIPALNFDLSEFLQCKRSTNDQTLKKIHTRNNYDKLFVVKS